MRFALAVVLPFVAQLIFIVVIVLLTNGRGSFVGLGACLIGMFALPLTALANWMLSRRKIPLAWYWLAVLVFLITIIFPIPFIVLYAVGA